MMQPKTHPPPKPLLKKRLPLKRKQLPMMQPPTHPLMKPPRLPRLQQTQKRLPQKMILLKPPKTDFSRR